jgi:hypothetical protein
MALPARGKGSTAILKNDSFGCQIRKDTLAGLFRQSLLKAMNIFLYTVTLLLLIAWFLGMLKEGSDVRVHLFLLLAIIPVMLRLIRGKGKNVEKQK